ncbi:MAG: adenylosuccinate lyase, partial [Nitrospirae bacterium]|nr:adenylosuccinate lyase [Nitrospirota bacterium]
MIERYSRPEMAAVWTTENKYSKWLQVEVLACEAWSKLGKVPASSVANIKKKAAFEAARVDEIEMVVKHDVIAFLTNVAEHVGEDSRYIHVGLTSSDVLDTALAIQMCEASDIIIKDITRLLEVLKARALEHKDTVMIGRSHGIHAEPTTFGLKMALWYDEMKRNLRRMQEAK